MKAEDIKFIVIHCSDSPQGRGDNAAAIHRWHIDSNRPGGAFDMIGYHHVILEDGTVENGRPTWMKGAHARGYNQNSIGVCMIGKGVYTGAQWSALPRIIHKLLGEFPSAVVCGHNDLDANKGCPLFDVKHWWNSL